MKYVVVGNTYSYYVSSDDDLFRPFVLVHLQICIHEI